MSSLKERAETRRRRAPLTHKEIRPIFYGLMLGGFLSAVNQTIVASALPTIGRDLGDFQNLSWVIIAYLLSSTVVAPLYGKLSDIHGRRAMMLVALGLFVAGSALCAVAPEHGDADRRAYAAGHRRRRHRARRADHSRRHGHAARARQLSGLYGHRLDRGRRGGAGARRHHRRPAGTGR